MSKTQSSTLALTDPAAELVGLARLLQHYQTASNRSVHATIGALLECSLSEQIEAVAAITARVSRLKELVSSVDDPFLDEHGQRGILLSALDQFLGLFRPEHAGGAWSSALKTFIREEDIRAIQGFSRTARDYRPLRRIEKEDRQQLLGKIGAALADMESRNDVPSWAKEPLTDGLRRLQLMVRHLSFFGHSTAIDQILLLRTHTNALKSAMDDSSTPASKGKSRFKAVLEAIALASTLFSAPHTNAQAYLAYHSFLLGPPAEQLLLPGPTKPNGSPAPGDVEAPPEEPHQAEV
jgi:hypothetical protein